MCAGNEGVIQMHVRDETCPEVGLLAAMILGAGMPCRDARSLIGLEDLEVDAKQTVASLVSVLGLEAVGKVAATSSQLAKLLPAATIAVVAAALPQNCSPVSHLVQERTVTSDDGFAVVDVVPADGPALAKLYRYDYVEAHMDIYKNVAGLESSSFDEWEQPLGSVEFNSVIADIAQCPSGPSGSQTAKSSKSAKSKKKGGAPIADPIQGLLKCLPRKGSQVLNHPIVGYILYELREKGSASKRQQYCEIVNIVVSSQYRGHGAGRLLYERLIEVLKQKYPAFAADVRLYVAECNDAPRAWYKRLGFRDAGWQSETIKGAEVKFVRMMLP